MSDIPTIEQIRTAARTIEALVHRTPIFTSRSIDQVSRARLFFKCENFQKVGAFKARGAVNAVNSLEEKMLKCGVATHSSGNHAAAVAYAASCKGVKAIVVMPNNASAIKIAAVEGYGAEIIYCEPTQQAREAALREVVKQTGAAFIHPYNDYRVITGQATAAMELLEQVPDLDAIITPVGGGGLISGTALAAKAISPQLSVYGAEPAGADDAFRSFQAGHIIPCENPDTIADGLRTSLGELTFPIICEHVSAIITVSDQAIINAMRLVWERMKIIIEPSSAVVLAALLTDRTSIRGARIGLIISGGNVDLNDLPWHK